MVNTTLIDNQNIAELLKSLNDTIKELNKKIDQLQVTVEDLKNENNLLVEENKYLKRKLFGSKSETAHSLGLEQLSLFDEAEKECDQELLEDISYTRSKKRHKDERKLKLENLKHVKDVWDIDVEERICDRCGNKLHSVGEEFVRSEVVYEPAKLYVKDIYRKTYECRKCRKETKFMMKAGTPAPVIPHSYASPSIVAQVITDKFVNHMPLYRQEAQWKRLKLNLSRATMANWIIIASKEYLHPLVDKMHEILNTQKHVHCDETTILVLNEPGKETTSKSYMWVYSSIKESETPIKIFEYHPNRSQINPQNFLKGFSGTIITDGYQGYNNIANTTNAYCWGHVRRKFAEAIPATAVDAECTLAKQALKKIAKLFVIEKEIESLSSEDKVKIRQGKSKPIVEDFFLWCLNEQDKVLARSKTGKAIQYALNLEKGLKTYLEDGLVPMTNNLDERSIRPFTVSRKNWLFSASTQGAEASGDAFSIIETAKANHLDPYDYLEYLFEMMPNEDFISNPNRIDTYLPWSKEIQSIFK